MQQLLENQLDLKNHSKFIFCCAPLLFVFFPAGLLLTEGEILSSASYVWRRGKPSTWFPRQKLAEERIVKGTARNETERTPTKTNITERTNTKPNRMDSNGTQQNRTKERIKTKRNQCTQTQRIETKQNRKERNCNQ